MKIGSVIVSYNPDINDLLKSIQLVISQVVSVVIVDNGSSNIREVEKICNIFDEVKLIKLGVNKGIGYAQNKGMAYLEMNRFDWSLMLDQDSKVPDDYVKLLINGTNLNSAGLITGAYVDVKWTSDELAKMRVLRCEIIEEINEEISSGNLILMQAWRDAGGFDVDLFIDYVDFDFDYKLNNLGYKIYRFNKVEFQHEIGSKVNKGKLAKLLLLEKKELFDHSEKRLFYMNRNRLIVRKRYKQFGSYSHTLLREIINLREVLVMSKPRLKKFACAVQGIVCGVLYKNKK